MILRLHERFSVAPFEVELANGKPTEKHLAAINALPGVLTPLNADQVIVRGVNLVNTKPFKDGRRCFRESAIGQIVKMLPGTPAMLNHDIYSREAMPVARTFAAKKTRDEDGIMWGSALWFTLANDDGRTLAENVDGGKWTEASVTVAFKTFQCSVCGSEAGDCRHRAGERFEGKPILYEIDDVAEVLEWSFVMSGMVEGTNFYLAASREPIETRDVDEVLAEREARTPAEEFFEGLENAEAARKGALSEFLRNATGA